MMAQPFQGRAQYADILEVVAPEKAYAGHLASIEVKVKNLAGYGIWIAATALFDGVQLPLTPGYAGVDPGAAVSFYGSFTMPPGKVTVACYSFYWTGSEWALDDSMSKTIDIIEAVYDFVIGQPSAVAA